MSSKGIDKKHEIYEAYELGYIRCEHDLLKVIENRRNNTYDKLIIELENMIDRFHRRRQQDMVDAEDRSQIAGLIEHNRNKYKEK